MHVALPVGNGCLLMATDALESMGQNVTTGTNFSISLDAAGLEEAERLFNGLSDGGQVTMPLMKMVWGAYFGLFNDKFGIQWMVNCKDN